MSSESTPSDLNFDHTSPYYLHPSDASFILVSAPFSGTNFNDWKRAVVIALSAKNKLAFIDGSIPKPELNSPTFKCWDRVNNTLMTWFMKILYQPIARSVLHFPTAFDIWRDLHERFGQTSGTQIFSIFQQLADTKQGSDSISSFYTKLKILWDEQDAIQPLPSCVCNDCTCRITSKLLHIQEEKRLIIFLMKFSSSFTQVRSSLLMQYPMPAISHAYRLLIQEEQHRQYSEFTTETPQAFLGNNRSNQSYRPPHYHNSTKGDPSRKCNTP